MEKTMETRQAIHPEQAAQFGTAKLREHFLVEELFQPGRARMLYSYYDRLIIAGVVPLDVLELDVDEKIIGASHLLERREMGVINIGGQGNITVDGTDYAMAPRDGLYIGMGARQIVFQSADTSQPAKTYVNCAPAHAAYPTTHIAFDEAEPLHLGEMENSNKRTIRKYFHPDGIRSCQLVMGMTTLETGCVWNTMPVHTHPRRIEAYLYFDMAEDNVVFHFMGEPTETRHVVVRNEEVVLSPSWSIHSGSGTGSYTFIWGMAGENQTFTDMDGVPMGDLR
jgi:4-deoxy-L-threo-5-hexosulose-uronate ketol-isomerase